MNDEKKPLKELKQALKKLSFIIHHSSIIIFLDLNPCKNFL